MQVDRGIDVTGDHLHPIAHSKIRRAFFPRQRTVLVAENIVRIPRVLALGQTAIRCQRLQSSVNGDRPRTLLADDRRQDRKAVGIERAHRRAVIRVHKDERPGLQLRHARNRGAELGRPRSTGGHHFDIESRLAERIRSARQRPHRLETLRLAIVVVVKMLEVALVALHTDQLQMFQSTHVPGESQRWLAGLDTRAVQAHIQVNQRRDRFVDTGARQRVVDGTSCDLTVHHNPDLAMLAIQFHQPLDLGGADNFACDEEVIKTLSGDGFGLADFRNASALCACFGQLAREDGAFRCLQVGADAEASGQQLVHQLLDVGLHQVEIDDHGRSVKAIEPVADLRRIHAVWGGYGGVEDYSCGGVVGERGTPAQYILPTQGVMVTYNHDRRSFPWKTRCRSIGQSPPPASAIKRWYLSPAWYWNDALPR